jgi:hypothetical protein
MAVRQTCQRCGSPLTETTSRGWCPSCLLREGLGQALEPEEADAREQTGMGESKVQSPESKAHNPSQRYLKFPSSRFGSLLTAVGFSRRIGCWEISNIFRLMDSGTNRALGVASAV